jgi:hypothetical protein
MTSISVTIAVASSGSLTPSATIAAKKIVRAMLT